jgi:hypothetical protein
MSAPSQFGSPQPSSGGGGSSVLLIVLIVLGVLVLVCGGLCAGCLYVAGKGATAVHEGIEEGLKTVQLVAAYANAETAVRNDPAVIARLGEPIERSTDPQRQNTGDLKPSGETFQFDVKGPNGTAIVSAVAVADGGPFRVTTITVKFPDGTTLDVKPPEEQFDPTDLKIDTGEPK